METEGRLTLNGLLLTDWLQRAVVWMSGGIPCLCAERVNVVLRSVPVFQRYLKVIQSRADGRVAPRLLTHHDDERAACATSHHITSSSAA